jgi:hypothetical protein
MSYASSAFASSVWTRSSAWSAPHLLAATQASSRRISSLGGPATVASPVQRQERREHRQTSLAETLRSTPSASNEPRSTLRE